MRRNVSLASVADETRISERFLRAIEEENFDQLPGIVFARNFVRQYALALDLDPDPLLAQLPKVDIADASSSSAAVRPAEREPRWDPRWNSAISSVVWLVLALAAAVGAYLHFNRATPSRAETATPVAVAKAPSKPVAAAPVPQAAAPAHPVEVVLTARDESWVQVTADGKIAFTAILEPNETRTVSADDQVKVLTGNAGGLSISLNGKALDKLGPSGQIRTVRLTAAGLQLVPKTPSPPSDAL